MEHKQYKRIIPDADAAILFIHGIAGTPNHFHAFLDKIPAQFSVYNILLDGHGGTVSDFSHTSMKKWVNQIDHAVDEMLQSHQKLYIVAHSMGCLLAMEQAIRKDRIVKLFLLAVPLSISLKPKMISNCLKVYFDRIHPEDTVAIAAKNCCSIRQNKNFLRYIGWIPRYLELFKKIRDTKSILHQIKIPCTVFQSGRDELVSNRSFPLLQKYPTFLVFKLENSSHYYYDENDFTFLLNIFHKWI